MHSGEGGASAPEHGRALAVALERLRGRGRDETGEERGREALAVDHDRLPARELRQQVVAALAGAAAAHHAACDLVAEILAQCRLRIQAGVDQQQARAARRGDRECGGRRVAEGQQVRTGGGEAAPELRQPEPQVVAERLEGDVLGLACALPVPRGSISTAPWPRTASARTSCTSARREPTASLASGETTSSARAASSGPSAYVNTGASGSPAYAAVGITVKLWLVPDASQARTPHRMGCIHPIDTPPDDASITPDRGTVVSVPRRPLTPARLGWRTRAGLLLCGLVALCAFLLAHDSARPAAADVPDVALTSPRDVRLAAVRDITAG